MCPELPCPALCWGRRQPPTGLQALHTRFFAASIPMKRPPDGIRDALQFVNGKKPQAGSPPQSKGAQPGQKQRTNLAACFDTLWLGDPWINYGASARLTKTSRRCVLVPAQAEPLVPAPPTLAQGEGCYGVATACPHHLLRVSNDPAEVLRPILCRGVLHRAEGQSSPP